MTFDFKQAWTDMVQPILKRPRNMQVAALCWREHEGRIEVLLITSRDTGRWILPKGWLIDGLDGPRSALQEAWEEAGVKEADLITDPIGSYDYEKRQDSGYDIPVEAKVYKARAITLSDDFPEADERTRKWVTPAEAATMVREPGLQRILRNM
ncbi:NUDIX hydrolase [Rhodobacteraceae bacterium KMM 6894]|nr:NUDIX hydrolase [Rhodobacteraceae bacterium KMM 6894]